MSKLLTSGGTLDYTAAKPYEIGFSGATDIILPFEGSVIIPGTFGNTPSFDKPDMADWLFTSLQFPVPDGGKKNFECLRDHENKPFKIEGSVLCMTARDLTPFERLDIKGLYESVKTDVVNYPHAPGALLQEIHVHAVRPKTLLLHFSTNITLPSNFPIFTHNKGYKLKTDSNGALTPLQTSLGAATLSGKIYAFDAAGLQMEAYTALRAWGIDQSVNNAPADDELRLQFVDLHGSILDPTELPVKSFQFKPGPGAIDSNWHWHRMAMFQDRTLKFTSVSPPTGTAQDEHYKYNHIHIAVWPGLDFAFHPVKPSGTNLELNKLFAEMPNNGLGFLRLCVFHPGDEMQTTGGGKLNSDGRFSMPSSSAVDYNDFHLYHSDNSLKVLNTGREFFTDFYKEIALPEEDELLEEIYLINWSSSAHTHLLGSMHLYNITPHDGGKEAVNHALDTISANHVITKFEQADTDDGIDYFLLLASHATKATEISTSFKIEVKTNPGGVAKITTSHHGFIRKGYIYGIKLAGNQNQVEVHTIKAYWKNSVGDVSEVAKNINASTCSGTPISVPEELFKLEINGQDPPQAVLKRKKTKDDVSGLLSKLSPSDIQLLLINLKSGKSEIITLLPTGSDADTNLTLATLSDMTAEDTLAVALIDRKSDANQDFTTTLLTSFRELKFSNDEHAAALVPFQPQELGGLLRQSIAAGVKVKALYWDQFLANLSKDDSYKAGHSNNVEISNLINRTVNGKRGFAVLDRATRSMGSYHQKATVLIRRSMATTTYGKKRIIAYVGGMDLTGSRWDTTEHFTLDPERQGGLWFDVHTRIEGTGALDVLRNFKQRWEAIGVFIDDSQLKDDCAPRNIEPAIKTETQTQFIMPQIADIMPVVDPDGFVQLNRTIPPFSGHAKIPSNKRFVGEAGEDGILKSYIKAINRARKFILINDQYFFSDEIALALHLALKKPNGPDFAIVVLPKDLEENEYIDPVLFAIRKRAIQCLFYGGTDNTGPDGVICGKISVNTSSSATSVKDKVALLFPRNRAGKEIYVHSKHMIVDDVWMTVGSSNINYRGMTYDWEFDVGIIGRRLYEGGTSTVRNQRIEICRLLLGLPKAYSASLRDPYAVFRMLKAIEGQGSTPTYRLHPLPPMVEKLDPGYVKEVAGDETFNDGVDFAVNLDMNSPAFSFLRCTVLDGDGRDSTGEIMRPILDISGIRNPLDAYANVSFQFNCLSIIQNAISAGKSLYLNVSSTLTIVSDGKEGPHEIYHLALELQQGNVVVIEGVSQSIVVPISSDHKVEITASLSDDTNQILNCEGEKVFDPGVETIMPGCFHAATITLQS